MTAKDNEVSFWYDENALELNSGYSYTMLNILRVTESYTYNW